MDGRALWKLVVAQRVCEAQGSPGDAGWDWVSLGKAGAGDFPEGLRCGDGVKGLFGLGRSEVWSALAMGKGGGREGVVRREPEKSKAVGCLLTLRVRGPLEGTWGSPEAWRMQRVEGAGLPKPRQ